MAENLQTEVLEKEIDDTQRRIERNKLIMGYRKKVVDELEEGDDKDKAILRHGEAKKVVEDDEKYLEYLKS